MRSFRRHKDQPQPPTTALVLLVLTISLLKPFSASALHFDNPCFMFPDGFDTHKHFAHQENASENGRRNGISDGATYSSKVHFRDKATGDVVDCVTQYTASSDSQQENPLGNESALLPNRVYELALYFTSCEDDDRQCEVSIASMTIVNHLLYILVVVFDAPLTDTTLLRPRGHLARPDSDCVAVNINRHKNTWRIVVLFLGTRGTRLNLSANVQWTIKRDLFGRSSSRITYDPHTKCLGVGWRDADGNSSNEIYRHYCANSSGAYMPEMVGVCVIAPHGSAPEYRYVQIWELSSVSPLPGEYPVSPLPVEKATDSWLKWLLIVMGGVVVLVVIIVAWVNYRSEVSSPDRERGGEEGNRGENLTEEFEKLSGTKKFSYEELMIATDSFARNRILGEGGFGAVYKGYMGGARTVVAVKKLKSGSRQGVKEYISEVKSLSQLRHRNLVQLIGYCHEASEVVLVYEFMTGGSLEDHLFKNRTLLTWERRYSIALGLASALHYLHKHFHQCVIHRDIKSSNIMLDEEFVARLGDFGLAKLVDHARGPNTTQVGGTVGYLAPEYFRMGKASKESDIYSFGVVLLEILCGRRVSDLELAEQGGLVPWVWKRCGCGSQLQRWFWNFHLPVDKRLGKDFNKKQAEALMIVGLLCAHPIATSRLSIEVATSVLNLTVKPPKLPSKIPSFNL